MKGSGQTRGWIIIGMDLLIVLVIYFLYSQFAFQGPDPVSSSFEDQFHYTLEVRPATSDTVPVTVSVSNPGPTTRSSELSNGLLLLLTDGGTKKYWTRLLLEPTTLTLDPNESRTWRLNPARPDDRGSLYVELFVDETRQTRVEVP